MGQDPLLFEASTVGLLVWLAEETLRIELELRYRASALLYHHLSLCTHRLDQCEHYFASIHPVLLALPASLDAETSIQLKLRGNLVDVLYLGLTLIIKSP